MLLGEQSNLLSLYANFYKYYLSTIDYQLKKLV